MLKVYSNKRRYLRHKLKEENKYSDERLVNEILQTYSFEEKINEETAQGSRNDFLAWLDEQKQSSMQEGDKDKAAKAMGGLAGFFGGKKED